MVFENTYKSCIFDFHAGSSKGDASMHYKLSSYEHIAKPVHIYTMYTQTHSLGKCFQFSVPIYPARFLLLKGFQGYLILSCPFL
jgi:hypothetical protein